MNKKIKSFYIEVMNCNYGKSKCPQAWKNLSTGLVPRAFNPCESTETEILVVAKNPGHPLEGETAFYKNKRGEALLKAKETWDYERRKRIQNTNDNSLKYHKNLSRYLRYFLGLSTDLETYEEYKKSYSENHEKEISKSVAFTNLFKCSTGREQERIKYESFDICYRKYFIREMQLLKPKIIVALGNEVMQFLASKQLEVPVVSIKHPSYFYRSESERFILSLQKKELHNKMCP